MSIHLRTTFLSMVLLLLLVGNVLPLQAQQHAQNLRFLPPLSTDEIIQQGVQMVQDEHNSVLPGSLRCTLLVSWFNQHPFIDYATCIETSITVKFINGFSVVLLNPFVQTKECQKNFPNPFLHQTFTTCDTNKTAIILNIAESMYGHHQCQCIISILLNNDYSVEYLANQAVDVSYIKDNLSASIIYMNTHAGYFDVDGDSQADAVVIATGERWTNETEFQYAYEIENHLIVKGMVGDQGFVAFTPAFIEQYYREKRFPNSLVYMATCFALYDDSMAEEFLDAGASAYMGWSQNTVFWINSRTSVRVFRLLSFGFSVHQVCRFIGSGGLYNWLFHSKLTYQGDGLFRIP